MSINYSLFKNQPFTSVSDKQTANIVKRHTEQCIQNHIATNKIATNKIGTNKIGTNKMPTKLTNLTGLTFLVRLSKLMKQMLAVTLVGSILVTTACQKTEDSESATNDAENTAEMQSSSEATTPSESDASDNSVYTLTDDGSDEEAANDNTLETLDETKPIDPTNPEDAESSANDEVASSSNANNQAAPQGETQITEVEYEGANGRNIHVTYQTSATSALQANVTMPSGKSILLTAPPAQGNNPTYQSADGQVELVTHAGGNKVDFIFQGKLLNFTAVETDAAVIVAQ